MRSRQALSLLEVVASLSLLALLFPLVLNLFPSAELARRKAERLQTATAIAGEWLEEARSHPPSAAGVDRSETLERNGYRFEARREVAATADPQLWAVTVTVGVSGQPPIRLATLIRVR